MLIVRLGNRRLLGSFALLALWTCGGGNRGMIAPQDETGSIQVTVGTTGETTDLDPNGYFLSVDASAPRFIAVNGTTTFQDLPPGSHIVRLDGTAENCTVVGENPRAVTVAVGATAEVSFALACAVIRGAIEIRVATVGADDPGGYTISLDGGPAQAITNEAETIDEVAIGAHSLLVGGLGSGCYVDGGNPRLVTVLGNQTVILELSVACPAGITGRIAFYSDRDGDFDIFVMNADGSNLHQLTHNSNVNDGHPTWSPDGSRIAFAGTRQDLETTIFHGEVLVMNADGSNEVEISRHPLFDNTPGWSVDDRIVFETNRDAPNARPFDDISPREIYAIDPDGTDLERVTDNAWDDIHPDWSPDGRRIVFSSELSPGNYEIVTMDPDGGDTFNLTNHSATDWRPAWSPDGTRIAFHSDREGNFEIYVMNTDGTGLRRLTNHSGADFHPAWSPNSRMIAFQSDREGGDFDIYIMNADGTGLVTLTANRHNDDGPAWTR